jgi:hypothetical protein
VLTAVNVVTKGADLLFWSWAIYLLQFNTAVRDAFTAGVNASAPTPSCSAR